jgi:phosphoribosylformylglycinamidine synthase
VSLYNETNGRAILPTPSIGGVGLIEDFAKSATLAFKRRTRRSFWSARRRAGSANRCICANCAARKRCAPPPVDLTEERENGDFVRALILDGRATAAHDLSDGGLLVGLAEMAMASGIGAMLDAAPSDIPAHAHWFGEDQARYLSRCRRTRRRECWRAQGP